jgi:sec-independent protein translocase protein TatC
MEEEKQATMSLGGHLGELRERLIRSCLCVLIFFAFSFWKGAYLLQFLKKPLLAALPAGTPGVLHFTGPMDVLMGEMKVAFLASVILSCPYWLYHFWRFLEPALYEKERRYILPCLGASVGLFLLGTIFCFYVVLPLSLTYLIQIGLEVGVPMITVTDYLSMVTLLILGFGIVFQTPLILILLALLDFVTAQNLAQWRRYMILFSLIVGAILTPPDVLSQLAMALPLYFMYEMSILIIRWIKP